VITSTVSVRDLPISADIGVHAHEVGRQQRLIITANIDIRLPNEDRIEQTLDYNSVVALAEQLGQTRIALIEVFAARLATALLDDPNTLQADVTVMKPGALLAGTACARIVARRA
jgi:dihydroneopterin aldolase